MSYFFKEEFQQGDLLSPYLFILVVSSLIYQALEKWDIHVVKIFTGSLMVFHLRFANVCFLFFIL